MPSFYPEGDTPIQFDSEQRSLQKIVNGGGGGGGGGSAPLTVGAGAPVASGTSILPFYWDSTNGLFYVWDGSAWNIH